MADVFFAETFMVRTSPLGLVLTFQQGDDKGQQHPVASIAMSTEHAKLFVCSVYENMKRSQKRWSPTLTPDAEMVKAAGVDAATWTAFWGEVSGDGNPTVAVPTETAKPA